MEKGFFGRLLCNAGYSEKIYEKYREDISRVNSSMIQTTSLIGGIMMLFLTVFSFFVQSISRVFPLYLGSAVVFCGIFAVLKIARPQNNKVILLCSYVFLIAAFFFAIGLDVIQKNPTATTVCVLLVALPLLIVDKPYREFIFFFVASVCFILESVFLKQSPKASVDILNSVCFLVIGCFLGYKHDQMMLRNIQSKYRLKHQRDTDSLTNLYNKAAFENLSRAYIEQNTGAAGLIIIDMDNFKYVNDTFGHLTGDEILVKVGELLSSQFRSSDYVCRFGGDEFVAFLPNVSDKDALAEKAKSILHEVGKLRIEADDEYRAQMCIGIAMYPNDADNFDDLFRNADNAMYRIKKNGKNGYGFYDSSLKKKILLVDDIEMNRVFLKKILEEDYEIIEAENGSSALEVLDSNSDITMVITDIQMPIMNGIELIKSIRSNKNYHQIAIVAETQFGETKQESEIIALGADEFIYKAASPSLVQKRVENVMKARELQI